MKSTTLAEMFVEQPVARCANVRTLAGGEYFWRQGEKSRLVYLVQSGEVALEISVPRQGPLLIDILHEGEFFGCSNLMESSRCAFDARALSRVSCLEIQGDRLCQLMERDQQLGYALLKRMAPMMAHKLDAAQLRLLDVHGLAGLRPADETRG